MRRAWPCIDELPIAIVIDLEPIIWSNCRDAFRLVHRDDLERSVVVEQLQIRHDAADAAVIVIFESDDVFADAEVSWL